MQGDLFTQASVLADADVPGEHVQRILAMVSNIPGPRDKPLPFRRIVSTRQCGRRAHVLVASLVMFDGALNELEIFQVQKDGREVAWGGFWSYVPEGFLLFKDGKWTRRDQDCFGVTYGIVHHELDVWASEAVHGLSTWTAEALADGLVSDSAYLHDRNPEDLLTHVKAWMASRKA